MSSKDSFITGQKKEKPLRQCLIRGAAAAREKNFKGRKKFIIHYENDCFRLGYYIWLYIQLHRNLYIYICPGAMTHILITVKNTLSMTDFCSPLPSSGWGLLSHRALTSKVLRNNR